MIMVSVREDYARLYKREHNGSSQAVRFVFWGGLAKSFNCRLLSFFKICCIISWLFDYFYHICLLIDWNMFMKVERSWGQTELELMKRSRVTKGNFIFVPGKYEIRGNEHSDRLIVLAMKGIGHAIYQAAVLNAIREAAWEEDRSNECESVTLNRLLEHQVIRDVTKQQHFAGSQRRSVN